MNHPEQFEHYVQNNPFYRGMEVTHYDNTAENVPAPLRLNDFIQNRMRPEAWVVFSHQDFSIREDFSHKLRSLDRACIYGPVGIQNCRSGDGASQQQPSATLERRMFGEILQGFRGEETHARLMGERVQEPREVNTVDGCCLIVHASLITKYGLRFDERFPFSLFCADFSINARKLHGIKTKVLQLECFHLSEGGFNAAYFQSLAELIRKHPHEEIILTGSTPDEVDAFRHIILSPRSREMLDGLMGIHSK